MKVGRSGDDLRIVNFSPALPDVPLAKDRTALARAGNSSSLNLRADDWHALARAVAQPDVAAALVKNDLFIRETVETATLLSLSATVFTTEVFPLLQPRAGAGALPVHPPVLTGLLDDGGNPTAVLSMKFEDHDHLSVYLKQTIRETRRTGSRYDESILARKVARPVLCHVVQLEFADGSDPVLVLTVRDGITRLVSAWAARMPDSATPEDIANEMVTALLSQKPRRGKAASTATQDYARGRAAVSERLRADFAAGMTGGTPTEKAIRIGQTFTLPAQVYVGVEPGKASPLPATEQFDDAARAVVSSIHVEFKGWDPAAEQVEVADRAMHRVRHAGELDEEVVDLATGVIDHTHTSAVFDDPKIPNTPLWRAVYLVAWLCSPPAYEGMKREIRALLGLTRVQSKRFVSLLAPIVDRPWRVSKAGTLTQARRAWGNGGPIPNEIIGLDWYPVPVKDFTKLVPKAVAGDAEARYTLQVAGGIALVTDKLVTSNIGSKLESELVPFRADVDSVITGLGSTEAGLWLLARAANAFDSDRQAINSFTKSDLTANPGLTRTAYLVPRLDPSDPSRIKTDKANAPEPITEGEIVRLSDPTRAARADADSRKKQQRRGKQVKKTEAERAADLRHSIRTGLVTLDDDLKAVLAIGNGSDGSCGAPLGTHDHWQDLIRVAGGIFSLIQMNEPPTVVPTERDDEDGEDEEGEGDEGEAA